jgi:transposase
MSFSGLRIFLCTTPTSMTYSFDRLMGLAQQTFEQDPLSGHLFLFLNRDRDRIKILFWDRDGFCIWYKRLEAGTFQLPTAANSEQGIELDASQLTHLLGGIDLRTGRRRKRYRRADKFVRQANSFENTSSLMSESQ